MDAYSTAANTFLMMNIILPFVYKLLHAQLRETCLKAKHENAKLILANGIQFINIKYRHFQRKQT